jgi:hypothetical protein
LRSCRRRAGEFPRGRSFVIMTMWCAWWILKMGTTSTKLSSVKASLARLRKVERVSWNFDAIFPEDKVTWLINSQLRILR